MGGSDVVRPRIAGIAQVQHSVLTYVQLVACGMSPRQIERAAERGEIRALHVGVYLVGPTLLRHSPTMAATLACGPRAVLSHRSAAWLYGILADPVDQAEIDVTITGPHRGHHEGIRVHRTTTLRAHEIREREGIPITAVPRTLIDFASCCAPAELEPAVAEAFALRLTNRSQLLRAIASAPGRRGVARLRTVLGHGRGPKRTRSEPERVLLVAVRAAGLPEPETNVRIGRWEVDLYWPDQGLVVEVDGYAAHSSPTAFERDRRKTAELVDRGVDVRRVSANQVRDELELTVRRIRDALRSAGESRPSDISTT